MASKMDKIKEQQRKKAEELAQREREHEKNKPAVKADTTDFADDLINAIENGGMIDVDEPNEPETTPEPELPKPEPQKEAPKKKPTRESAADTKPAEKKGSENKPAEKEESMSLSSMLMFRAKAETKSVHRSISMRPATMQKADKLLKEHYNGLSFNDLIQQLVDVWVAENEKHFNI